ncbi:MAG: recombinase family protein [Lachnospiraceae bacterium]|nr:recombinase family protein [Lachnospiraceae bacterium]
MKRVRMLLRVSSNQQLEADGDLSVQRQIVKEYIKSQSDWILDDKEYFEGSNSGYKKSVVSRDVLQEALQDAERKEYDILVVYKDDRVGRLMWEIGSYVMTLKSFGVDIYTVKDGCISPDAEDIMGQMMLALRYGNAQKSSADTGMRVKDTAQKMVQMGKFMGGRAPYGYRLELSGEISKHGRALHKLVIVQEQAEVVRYIFRLSLNKEFGSVKIANTLNRDEAYRRLSPGGIWKSGMITSILTNPVYAGYVAYKRRERKGGKYRRLDSREWIMAAVPDAGIQIVNENIWNRVQEKRKGRADKYKKTEDDKKMITVNKRNDGILPLLDVIYCGCCKKRLVNGTRYSYWTIKRTGERRKSKVPFYCCETAMEVNLHGRKKRYQAEETEKVVFFYVAKVLNWLLEKEDMESEVKGYHERKRESLKRDIGALYKELEKIGQRKNVLQSHIAEAMTGEYPFSVAEIADAIHLQEKVEEEQKKLIRETEQRLSEPFGPDGQRRGRNVKLSTWGDVFMKADNATKRVIIKAVVERIEITGEQIAIKFRVNPGHPEITSN